MTGTTPAELLREEAALIKAGLAVQQQGLDLLLGEMHALAAMLPGQNGIASAAPPSDAEVEEGFDNMPV
jgi:hypothetical protein